MGRLLSLSKQPLLVWGQIFGKWLPAWARLGPLSMDVSFSDFAVAAAGSSVPEPAVGWLVLAAGALIMRWNGKRVG